MKTITTLLAVLICALCHSQFQIGQGAYFYVNGDNVYMSDPVHTDHFNAFIVDTLGTTATLHILSQDTPAENRPGIEFGEQPYGTAYFIVADWFVSSSALAISAQDSVSGDGFETTFVVTHDLGFIPTSIDIQPMSQDAAGPAYISEITSSTFTIVFLSPPPSDSDNVVFTWTAHP